MKGCRPLTDDEIERIKKYFNERKDKFALRDFTLFFFALHTGFRISELLSVRVQDIYRYNRVIEEVYLKRMNTKGKHEGRRMLLNEKIRFILTQYITQYDLDKKGDDVFLFPNPSLTFPISTRHARRIFEHAYVSCELTGKLSCHTTRKTFAQKISVLCDRNIVDVQQALGHRNITSTTSYIDFSREKVDSALTDITF